MKTQMGKFLAATGAWVTAMVALTGFSSFRALAEDGPMIEVGTGLVASLVTPGYTSVLVRVRGFGINAANGSIILAKFKTDVAFGSGTPYFDIEFTPVSLELNKLFLYQRAEGDPDVIPFERSSMGFLRTTLHRDINLDQKTNLQIDAFGVNFSTSSTLDDERNTIFLQGVISGLGVKVLDHYSKEPFAAYGHIARANLEAGLMRKLSHQFQIRLTLGGEADCNAGSSFQSNLSSYAELRLDFVRRLSLFVRASVLAAYRGEKPDGSEHSFDSYLQGMTGMSIQF